MHSSRFEISGYKGEVTVHHNGDWSGNAFVEFQEETFGSWDKTDKGVKEVEIPAKLLVGIGLKAAQQAVGEALASFAEDLPNILRIKKLADESVSANKKKKKK